MLFPAASPEVRRMRTRRDGPTRAPDRPCCPLCGRPQLAAPRLLAELPNLGRWLFEAGAVVAGGQSPIAALTVADRCLERFEDGRTAAAALLSRQVLREWRPLALEAVEEIAAAKGGKP